MIVIGEIELFDIKLSKIMIEYSFCYFQVINIRYKALHKYFYLLFGKLSKTTIKNVPRKSRYFNTHTQTFKTCSIKSSHNKEKLTTIFSIRPNKNKIYFIVNNKKCTKREGDWNAMCNL